MKFKKKSYVCDSEIDFHLVVHIFLDIKAPEIWTTLGICFAEFNLSFLNLFKTSGFLVTSYLSISGKIYFLISYFKVDSFVWVYKLEFNVFISI